MKRILIAVIKEGTMKKLMVLALILVALVATLGWTQHGASGNEYTRIQTKSMYGNIDAQGREFVDYKSGNALDTWEPTTNVVIIGIDAHLKPNFPNYGYGGDGHLFGVQTANLTDLEYARLGTSHASMTLRVENETAIFYIAAFDGGHGLYEQTHLNVMFPVGYGIYLDAGKKLLLWGRAIGKTSGHDNYSGCFTIYYVNR